jgi:superoxide reductase
MKRREFLKGSLLATLVLVPGKTLLSTKEAFGEKLLLRLTNRENPSVLEQKHVPAIETSGKVKAGDWFDVKVTVGFMKEHPSVPNHWISSIKLLIDGKEIAGTDFPVGGTAAPRATFKIKLDKTSKIEAAEHCNLHGTWISDPLTIEVI